MAISLLLMALQDAWLNHKRALHGRPSSPSEEF